MLRYTEKIIVEYIYKSSQKFMDAVSNGSDSYCEGRDYYNMDERMIFAVLGIERTKDEDAIRAAYRVLLPMTNPEDDPEGFKRLREAYEKALEYARAPEPEETEKPKDHTPVGEWMQQVEKVYFSLPRRLNEEEWKHLIHEDICVDLEYGEEAKWKLFAFLADHYQLPSRIYRLLDETFRIREDAEGFREHLPVEFVNFLLRKIGDANGSMDFDFGAFTGAENADYDGFIDNYYTLCEQTQKGDAMAASQTVRAMEELAISHPLFQLEKARTAQLLGEREEAVSLVRPLIAEYKESSRIQILGAEIFYQCGLHSEAEELLLPYSENRYYLVEKYLCFCEEEKGNLAGAIRHCLRALGDGNDEELGERLRQMDEKFIREYAKKAEDASLTDEEANCLIGCYNRRDKAQEALDFLEKYPDYAGRMERLHEYLAILYFQIEHFAEGIAECRRWRELLPEREELTEEKRREEEIRSYVNEGDGFRELAKRENNENFFNAWEAYETAGKLEPENLNIRQRLLDTMIEMEYYEDAVKLADEMLAVDAQWFPAYVQKQKACFELHRAQEVVDCFYTAKRIYAGFADIYEKAAEVFLIYDQYGDAEHIFAQAQEANVTSPMLDVLKLRCMRLKEVSNLEELRRQGRVSDFRLDQELTKLAKDFKAKYKAKPAEGKEMCSLYQELGLLERDRRHFKDAVRNFRAALKYENRMYCHYLLANALFDSNQEEAALKEYHIYEEATGPGETLYINMARCYRSAGQRENSILYFKKVLEVNEKNDEANAAIAKLYRNMMVDSGNIYYGQLAKPYADRQLELMPDDAYYLRERGLLFLEMNLWEKALADFDRSLEVEKNPYGFNLKGKTFYYMGRYEAAMNCYELAIQYMDAGDMFMAPYLNAGDCRRNVGKFEDAEYWYRRAIHLFKNSPQSSPYDRLYWMYKTNGEFRKAKEVLEEQWAAKQIDQEDYEDKLLLMDTLIHEKKGDTYVERAKKLAESWDTVDAWMELSYQYQFEANDLEMALKAALTAYRKAKKTEELWEENHILIQVMDCYSLLGNTERASIYARMFQEELLKEYSYNQETDAMEQYLSDLQEGKENAYYLALSWLGLGELEEAEKILKMMQETGLCRKCSKKGCTELFELQGKIYEAKGERKAALESYQRALEIDPSLRESRYRVKRLNSGQK